MDNWAEIIEAAAKSPEGIIALAMLIISGVALKFFPQNEHPGIRLGVFATLVVGAGLAIYALLTNPGTAESDDQKSPVSEHEVEPSVADCWAEYKKHKDNKEWEECERVRLGWK